MADTSLRARSATEIVDAAFTLYKRDFLQYLLITSIAYAPAIIAMLLIGTDATSDPAAATGFLLTMLVSLIANALMTGTIVSLGSQVYLGEPLDVAAAVRRALPRVPAILLSMLLLGFLYLVGLLCFLVGFLYVAARFFAVIPAIVLEGKGPIASFGRSSQLSDGRKPHVLGTLALVYGIYLLASIGLTTVMGIATFLSGNSLLLLLSNSLFTIVAFPIIGLATMVLYYDARIRGEGFDLERMAQGLGHAPAMVPTSSPVT